MKHDPLSFGNEDVEFFCEVQKNILFRSQDYFRPFSNWKLDAPFFLSLQLSPVFEPINETSLGGDMLRWNSNGFKNSV